MPRCRTPQRLESDIGEVYTGIPRKNRGNPMSVEYSIVYRLHAVLRMGQRGISEQEVEQALRNGEVVERYDDDTPYPSRLILSPPFSRPLHVVAAWNEAACEWIVITVYEPAPDRWYPDHRRRRI